MLYWLCAGMAPPILRELRKISTKKSKHKARFEPATFCSTRKTPNHYTAVVVTAANHYPPPPFHRQILETNPANHWQPIPKPQPLPSILHIRILVYSIPLLCTINVEVLCTPASKFAGVYIFVQYISHQ